MTLPFAVPSPPVPEPTKRRTTRKTAKAEVVRAGDIDWSTVRRGVWLVAGTPVGDPYPCLCPATGFCRRHCECAGRTDTAHLPQYCCAVRAVRRQTVAAGPVPLPPRPLLHVSKLRSPAPASLVDLIAVTLGLTT